MLTTRGIKILGKKQNHSGILWPQIDWADLPTVHNVSLVVCFWFAPTLGAAKFAKASNRPSTVAVGNVRSTSPQARRRFHAFATYATKIT